MGPMLVNAPRVHQLVSGRLADHNFGAKSLFRGLDVATPPTRVAARNSQAILAAATAASSHDLFGPEISACPVSPGEKPDADEAIWSENPPPPSDSENPPPPSDSENPPPTSDQATSEDPQKPQGWDWDEDFGKPLGPDVEKPDAEQSWNWDEDWKPSGEDGADVVAPGGDGADVAPGGGKTPEAEEAIWSENPPPPDAADGLEAINLGEEEPLWSGGIPSSS